MVHMTDSYTIQIFSINPSVVEAMRNALSNEQDFNLLADELNSESLNHILAETKPDVILLDFSSLYQPYFLAHKITRDFPECELVAILDDTQAKFSERVIQLGARAYIQYPLQSENLPDLIRSLFKPIKPKKSASIEEPFINNPPINQRTYTIFSPKGGAGCTTVATNLAISLHNTLQEDVLLIDGKNMFGHVALYLNILTGNSIADLLAHANMLDQQLINQVVLKHQSGIHVLPSPNSINNTEEIKPESLFPILETLKNYYPNIIIDGGNYLNENSITNFDVSEKIILILNPDLASMRDIQQFMEISNSLSYAEDKLTFILNLAERKIDMRKDEIEKILNIKLLSQIPFDDNFARICLNEGVPMIMKKPQHPISKSYQEIAKSLIDNKGDRC